MFFFFYYLSQGLINELFTTFSVEEKGLHLIDVIVFKIIISFILFLFKAKNYLYYDNVFLFLKSVLIIYFAYIVVFYQSIFLYWCNQIWSKVLSKYVYESWVLDIWVEFLKVSLLYNLTADCINFLQQDWFKYNDLFFFIIFVALIFFAHYFLVVDTYLSNDYLWSSSFIKK